MYKVALLVVVAQVLLVQNTFAQCGGNNWGMSNNLLGVGNLGAVNGGVGNLGGGYGGANIQSSPSQSAGGWGTGEVIIVGTGEIGIVGELPVGGTTNLQGSLPVIGAIQFNGQLPAGGVVSIVGSAPGCGCGCGSGY